MLEKIEVNKIIFLDIETVPLVYDFKELDKGSAQLWDKKSKYIQKYQEVSVEEAYQKAGIYAEFGKIVCISFGYIDNAGEKKISSYYGDDEKDIVNSFNELLKKIEKKTFNLSGFRINYFDIPWVLHKLHKYGIKPANIIYMYDKKPWDVRVVDLSDDWKTKFAWAFSFATECFDFFFLESKSKAKPVTATPAIM